MDNLKVCPRCINRTLLSRTVWYKTVKPDWWHVPRHGMYKPERGYATIEFCIRTGCKFTRTELHNDGTSHHNRTGEDRQGLAAREAHDPVGTLLRHLAGRIVGSCRRLVRR